MWAMTRRLKASRTRLTDAKKLSGGSGSALPDAPARGGLPPPPASGGLLLPPSPLALEALPVALGPWLAPVAPPGLVGAPGDRGALEPLGASAVASADVGVTGLGGSPAGERGPVEGGTPADEGPPG